MEINNRDFSLLISILDDIASIKNMDQLFFNIFTKLSDLYKIKFGGVGLVDKNKAGIATIIAEMGGKIPMNRSNVWMKYISEDQLPFRIIQNESQIRRVNAAFFENFEPLNSSQPAIKDIHSMIDCEYYYFLPMKTGGDLLGYFILSAIDFQISSENLDYYFMIANILGATLKNTVTFHEIQQKEKEKEFQIGLLTKLISIKNRDELHSTFAEEVNKLIPSEYLSIYSTHNEYNIKHSFSLLKDETGRFQPQSLPLNVIESLVYFNTHSVTNDKYQTKELQNEAIDELCKRATFFCKLRDKSNIKSYLVIRYIFDVSLEIYFILGRKDPQLWLKERERFEYLLSAQQGSFFIEKEIDLCKLLIPQIGLVLGNLYAFERIESLTKKLEQEKNCLLEEINLSTNFEEIIGSSESINITLNKVKQVAPLDATVLILGETGTGKELIAKAVHNLSKRKENAFITINCAALPTQLIESELFGHEKGSFTGAIETRIGKFEIADKGTIFLDEIGELPLETQAKLLRVLQEKEFERIGGKSTKYSDVRIIAATNRNLEKEIEEGRFRSDLYFRLNVFPIIVAPLRERKEDIPLLLKHFIEKYSKRIGKSVTSINKNDLEILSNYQWPGNVRELEHMVERAIIISDGTNLNFEKMIHTIEREPEPDFSSFKTLEEMERQYIIEALKYSDGKVTGENSAAKLLGLNGKTLGSKMKKLGIKRKILVE